MFKIHETSCLNFIFFDFQSLFIYIYIYIYIFDIPQLWDKLETWGFREYIKDIKDIKEDDDEVEDNDKDDVNNGNGISALELYRDLVFSRVPSCGTPMT